jgi:hypothetical protein
MRRGAGRACCGGWRPSSPSSRAAAAGDPLVLEVLTTTRELLAQFAREIGGAARERRRIAAALAPIVGQQNVLFDPFTLRQPRHRRHRLAPVGCRACVVRPDREEQVAPAASGPSGAGAGKAIPRGAGTGLTGGAVPFNAGCVMINTEKLDRIIGVRGAGGPSPMVASSRQGRCWRPRPGWSPRRAIEAAKRQGWSLPPTPPAPGPAPSAATSPRTPAARRPCCGAPAIDNLLSLAAWPWRTGRSADRAPPRSSAAQDPARRGPRALGGRRGQRRGAARRGICAADQAPQKGAVEGHHQQGLGRLPGLQKEGTRRRHHRGWSSCSTRRYQA